MGEGGGGEESVKYAFTAFIFVFAFDALHPSQKKFRLVSTKYRIKCLSQGHNTMPPVRLELATSISSQALYHGAITLLRHSKRIYHMTSGLREK